MSRFNSERGEKGHKMSIRIYTQNSKYYMEDNGTTTEITNITKDGISLILPDNSSNRRYCSIEKALKGITLDYKETKTFGPRDNSSTSKTPKTSNAPKLNELVELLTDDERKIYKELMDKAAMRLAEKKKRERVEALRAEIAALEAELNG
jgi:hypothetical protein